MGFHVVVVSRSGEKAVEAQRLGVHNSIDTTKGDPAVALRKLGGARVILATAVSGHAASTLVEGLGRNGCLMLLAGSPDSVIVKPGFLIAGRRRVQGWSSGQASDSEATRVQGHANTQGTARRESAQGRLDSGLWCG
ncbi:MAG: zinc-binding dehydrogenase [Terriglobia bacterium]